MNRVYNTITEISLSLDSRHGLQDVDPPPSFEGYLSKRSLGQGIFLQELLLVLRLLRLFVREEARSTVARIPTAGKVDRAPSKWLVREVHGIITSMI